MTKKEQAEMESLRTRIALRWTEPVEPDIPIPPYGETTTGWLCRGGYLREYWSKNYSHSSTEGGVASQGGIALHSSAIRALKSHRSQLERECAAKLRDVDRKIERLEAEQVKP